jgi:hypothetical protein
MTRRVVVLFAPSKYERLRAIADRRGISFNELVNRALDFLPEMSEPAQIWRILIEHYFSIV